jgi:phage terminase large subunit-like protein
MPRESAFSRLADSLANDWRVKARPEQRTPEGSWQVWLYLAGRGTGKTRTGSEWVHEKIRGGARRIALVAATSADVRDVVVEGTSGLLATAPKHARPEYEPSKRRLTWPNGAIATTFSADEPDRLRGPEHEFAWCDELAAWNYQETAWQNLMLGLRLGRNPQVFVSTTPRPTKLIKGLVAREGLDVVVTRGKTFDNAANLAPAFIDAIKRQDAHRSAGIARGASVGRSRRALATGCNRP